MTPTARPLILYGVSNRWRWVVYGALALTLAAWGAAKVNAYIVGRDAREAAANQLVVLEALGARKATVAARNAEKRLAEMQAVVPGLERELAAAKAAGAPAAIVLAAEGEGTGERIPCEELVAEGDDVNKFEGGENSHDPRKNRPAGSAPSITVAPGARFEAAIFPTADGTIAWKSKLWGWTVYGEGKRTARQEIPTATSDLVVDPQLGKAWAAYQDRPSWFALLPRAPRHWRIGWSCGPGGGVSFAGEGWAGAACVYGPQF